MVWIAGIALALALAIPWLRGSWMMAAILTPVWFTLSGPGVSHDGTLLFIIGAAVIWTPFAIWRLIGSTRPPLTTTRAMLGFEITR